MTTLYCDIDTNIYAAPDLSELLLTMVIRYDLPTETISDATLDGRDVSPEVAWLLMGGRTDSVREYLAELARESE